MRYPQERICDFMLEAVPGDSLTKRLLRRMYAQSSIEFRYSVLGDLGGDTAQPFFTRDDNGLWRTPTTARRNARYATEAPPLFVSVARDALARSGFSPDEVTHVVTVSCTGFFNPGPDYHIVRGLGLADDTDRIHVGFMGCYALFPALKVADAICRADASAVVIVASVELCTLHVQLKAEHDAMLGACLFGDGAGACIVSAQQPRPQSTALTICALGGQILPDSAAAMAWTIGDDGFDITLSSYVPDLIRAHIRTGIDAWLAGHSTDAKQIARWAIHPGGRAILDKSAAALELAPDVLDISRSVLRDVGNLSSTTLFFVLERMLREPPSTDGETILAAAFGPGLTLELGLFTRP